MATYSVVIPTRNRSGLLQEAVTSVLEQSSPADEIIIVDDASDTVLRRGDFPEAAPIQVVRFDTPRGACAARNVALEACTSEYVAFLDDDDKWHPNKMRRQIHSLEKNPDLVAVTTYWCTQTQRATYSEGFSSETCRKFFGYENLFGPLSLLCMRRNSGTAGLRFDESLESCQDWDYYMALSRVGNLAVIEEHLAVIRAHPGRRITSNLYSRKNGLEVFVTKHLADLSSSERRWIAGQLAANRGATAAGWHKFRYLVRILSAATRCGGPLPRRIVVRKTIRRAMEMFVSYHRLESWKSSWRGKATT